jgi:hypothetical protein
MFIPYFENSGKQQVLNAFQWYKPHEQLQGSRGVGLPAATTVVTVLMVGLMLFEFARGRSRSF